MITMSGILMEKNVLLESQRLSFKMLDQKDMRLPGGRSKMVRDGVGVGVGGGVSVTVDVTVTSLEPEKVDLSVTVRVSRSVPVRLLVTSLCDSVLLSSKDRDLVEVDGCVLVGMVGEFVLVKVTVWCVAVTDEVTVMVALMSVETVTLRVFERDCDSVKVSVRVTEADEDRSAVTEGERLFVVEILGEAVTVRPAGSWNHVRVRVLLFMDRDLDLDTE
jgi:hypothetical protein